MVDAKTVVVSVVVVLYVCLQPGIRAQTSIGSSNEEDFCPQPEEGCESEALENMRLRSELEGKRQKIEALENKIRRLTARDLQSERATLTGRLQITSPRGITKVEDRIYVLGDAPDIINVYEDQNDFRFIEEIALNETQYPYDIVYSKKSKCVYISDLTAKCIWVMTTTGEHRLSIWLTNVIGPQSLSLSNEGHLLVLRVSQSFGQLDIYSLDATFIRRVLLPEDVTIPFHVVQTSAGNFIISHRLDNGANYWTNRRWVISQLTNDGKLIHRFIPRNQSEKLNEPQHLSLDSDNNRLFVADYGNHRVILFDSSNLTWSQVLVFEEMNGNRVPFRLFYDASKRHLFVAQQFGNVTVYEIN